jgi:hypothetical protein
MRRTILFVLVLALGSSGLSCKLFRGSSSGCSFQCQVGTTYNIEYTNPSCPPREIDNVTCFGFLNYPKDCQGTCQARFVPKRFFGFFLTASPTGADLNNLPTSVTVSGQGIDATYGAPRIEYLDSEGYVVGMVYATATSNGSWLTAPVPDLSTAYTGTFTLQVTNKDSNGDYADVVGTANLNCWGRDRPDSDSDGWYDDEDCYPTDPLHWNCYEGGGGGGDDPPGCLDWCNMY